MISRMAGFESVFVACCELWWSVIRWIYNTPIPSSAGVERLFSVGKDILKPNRCALKDGNFEKLIFFLHEKKC